MHEKSAPTGIPAVERGIKPASLFPRWGTDSALSLLPLVLWIWLCHDWPTRLGFYSDDWMVLLHPAAGTTEAFHHIYSLVATRPVSAPYIWLSQVIINWSPYRSQILNIAMLLVAATSVGLLAAALCSSVSRLRRGSFAGACVACAAFIVFPSNVGTFAWGTGTSTVVPALPLFCIAITLLLFAEESQWRLWLGLFCAALSHLAYETFYFQEITFICVAAILRGSMIKDIPRRTLVGAGVLNLACVLFNRLMPEGIPKTFHWDLIQTFNQGYGHIFCIMGHAAGEHSVLIAWMVLIAGLQESFASRHWPIFSA